MKNILRQSILGSVSYCLVIFRTPPYWLVRVASCNSKIGGKFLSLPITHSKRYDVQTFVDESKDLY